MGVVRNNKQYVLFPRLVGTGCKPLLKWAGGKSALLDVLQKAAPRKYRRYAEIFFGGGAFFWNLSTSDALIADSNPELINFYLVVRDTPLTLLEAVKKMPISKDAYYGIRAQDPNSLSSVDRAARLVYLNKTCYNGLYRVNQKGKFNTPFGGKTNVTILDENNLLKASTLLQEAEILCLDFTESLGLLKDGDFVYLDPPYLPLGGYADFRRYTRQFFNEEHHVRLAIEFGKLRRRGVNALLSNSASTKIERLYKNHWCVRVMAPRQISCRADGRKKIAELLVANYPLEEKDVIS